MQSNGWIKKFHRLKEEMEKEEVREISEETKKELDFYRSKLTNLKMSWDEKYRRRNKIIVYVKRMNLMTIKLRKEKSYMKNELDRLNCNNTLQRNELEELEKKLKNM